MKNQSKTPIIWAVAIGVFWVIALLLSQYYFNRQFNLAITQISSFQERLDTLVMNLDSTYNSEQILAIQKARLDIQKEQFDAALDKEKQQLFWYNISFLGIGTFLGFVTLLFWIPKEIEKRAKLEVDEKIADAIRGRSETIQNMLKDYDDETFLLQNKRIYVIGEKDDALIRKVLQNAGFNFQNYYKTEDQTKNGFDVLLINDRDGTTDIEDIALVERIKSLPKDVAVFYYNSTRKPFDIKKFPDMEDKISFVNAASQIYGNLLNILKYQDKLEKN